jgi:3-hydroxyacyl-CoA dehydrogenase/enoyl-CoA hydratase/3-hydroxybutyryl-CoA epimerase
LTVETRHPALTWHVDEHGIAHVVFDAPGEKVNLLGAGVLEALNALLDDLRARAELCGVVVRSAKRGMFIAGMDVEEIASVDDTYRAAEGARFGQAVFQKLASLEAPTVCAIGGACMGGGTELALACTFRLAADDPALRIALPETQIGIVPGFGGTQRLPRLIGLMKSLDLILPGKRIDARQARKIGLVDGIAPTEYLVREAVALVLRARDEGVPVVVRALRGRRSPVRRALEEFEPARRLVLKQARKRTAAKVRPDAYPAPFRALEAIDAAFKMNLTQGLDLEARIVGELVPTRTSKSLIWLFKNNTALRRGDAGLGVAGRPVRKVGVLGAGTMGGGIAQLAADRDLPVRLRDLRHEPVLDALRTAHAVWDRRRKRRRMTRRQVEQKMRWISPTLDLTGMNRVDVVIEAVVEDLDVKRKVLAELEERLDARAVFASNTSSIPIGDIAARARHPERVVGMHFFNPVHRMPLVEVIAGPRSSAEAVATVRDLAIRFGKTPVVVRDTPGFLVNRILTFYLAEAMRLLEEGVPIETVDPAMESFGMPMGPFALMDQVGLDVAVHVAGVLREAFGDRASGSTKILDSLIGSGRLGAKNGKGFYRYRDGKKTVPDRETYNLAGVGPSRPLPPETVQERLVLSMLNEAAVCLEEQVVRTPTEVDMAMVLGTGFPPFRGGLLHHADETGIGVVVDRLTRLADAHGDRFRPAERLRRMVREERRFFGGGAHRSA